VRHADEEMDGQTHIKINCRHHYTSQPKNLHLDQRVIETASLLPSNDVTQDKIALLPKEDSLSTYCDNFLILTVTVLFPLLTVTESAHHCDQQLDLSLFTLLSNDFFPKNVFCIFQNIC